MIFMSTMNTCVVAVDITNNITAITTPDTSNTAVVITATLRLM